MKNQLAAVTGVLLAASMSVASADDFGMGLGKGGRAALVNPNPVPLSITNTISSVNGHVNGFVCPDGSITGNPADVCGPTTILYPIAGIVLATVTDSSTGETVGGYNQVGTITATVEFPTSFFGLMGNWSALPSTLPWTMQNDFSFSVGGSTLVIEEGLDGRAFPHLGPVEDPNVSGTMALRMAGCMGVREVSGEGDYASKVGTLCLNGTFSFDQQFNGAGVSNCTIALHDKLN